MAVELPEDVLHLICNEIRLLPDSSASTLYNLAMSGRRFAPLAFASLYKYPRSPGAMDELEIGGDQLIMRWAIMWKSIYQATQGTTLYPYHQYLRWLDLQDLENLIGDSKFYGRIEKFFWSGHLDRQIPRKPQIHLLDHIGDAIVAQNSLIEEISGRFSVGSFERWVSILPRLRRLDLWDGNLLESTKAQELIATRCPNFQTLSMLRWTDKAADIHLGPFLEKLEPNRLETLISLGTLGMSTQTALALNRHGQSLTQLRIDLDPVDVPCLALLKNCRSLEKLQIEVPGIIAIDMDAVDANTSREFTAWLCDCKRLKDISIRNIQQAADALTALMLDESIQLEALALNTGSTPFFTENSPTFHLALSRQQKLQSLWLRSDAESEESTDAEIDSFIEAVSQLQMLRRLELFECIMEAFNDDHVVRMLIGHELLEDVFIGGQMITDVTLPAIATLKHLKRITIMAITRFSLDGLLTLVGQLDKHGNDQLQMDIEMADPEYLLGIEEQTIVRDELRSKVNGVLDYQPLRGKSFGNANDRSGCVRFRRLLRLIEI